MPSSKTYYPIFPCLTVMIGCAFFSSLSAVYYLDTFFASDVSDLKPHPFDQNKVSLEALRTRAKSQKFGERGHLCYGLSFNECFQKVFHLVNQFMRSETESSFRIEANNTLFVRDPDKSVKEELIPDWDFGLEEALQVRGKKGRRIRLHVVESFYYNAERWQKAGYTAVAKRVNISKHRLPGVSLNPVGCSEDKQELKMPWLAQFRNAFVNNDGVVLVPFRKRKVGGFYDARAYDLGGGCCQKDWRNIKGKAVSISLKSVEPCLFSNGQYHGSTYHHALTEQVPRHLAFWKLLSKLENVKITVRGNVLEEILEALGWPRTKTTRSDSRLKFWAAKKLYMPAPFYQDRPNYSNCADKLTSKIFRALVDSTKTVSHKPLILVLDRAVSRAQGRYSSCVGKRCIHNLPVIVSKLKQKFRQQACVQTLRHHDEGSGFISGVSEFKRAKMVIGAHGAGFQNIMFMEEGGHAIHLGWQRKWELYARLAERHGISFRNVLIRGMSHASTNCTANVEEVIQHVNKVLSGDNFSSPRRRS